MTGTTGSVGRFVKAYCDPGTAREALRRSQMLRKAGVQTPAVFDGPEPKSLAFARIDGPSGVCLLECCDMLELLSPLRALHAVPPVGLPDYDPLLRIRPRLARLRDPAPFRDLLARLVSGLPRAGTTLHGDFHFGQLIRDGHGSVWILDLDDMATGPPEADLGNLIAHLATSEDTARPRLAASLAFWRDRVIAGWGQPCDAQALDKFTRIAALRRALKLREQRRADFLAEVRALLSVA